MITCVSVARLWLPAPAPTSVTDLPDWFPLTSRPAMRKSLTTDEVSKRAVAYYRSSAEDAESDIDRQREQVRRWAEKHGVEIVREFEDRDTSALDKQRFSCA